MKKTAVLLLLLALLLSLSACANKQTAASESDFGPQNTSESSAEPEQTPAPYKPMDIFSDEFNPFGMDRPSPFTVFEAYFDKGSAKLVGKNPFVLSMTGSGNMFACVAYQADAAGLSLDDDGKMKLLEEYIANDGFLEFTGKDGRIVTIGRADKNDDRYEYVESDGSHGIFGAGCVISLTHYVSDEELEKYTQLVRDNYSLEALSAISDYMDVETDFAECGIYVNLHKDIALISVAYYVSDAEAMREIIAANVKSDWWEWRGNMETYIGYNDRIGYKLIVNKEANAVTAEQGIKNFSIPPAAEGSLTAMGFVFDDAGTCGVYEDREPHYKSVAIARPEWGDHPDDWNIEFMDTDIKGYSLRITYHADDGKYHISLDKDGKNCAYDCYPEIDEFGWEDPDIDTVHQMFGDAFDSQGKELYYPALAHFEQYVQKHFGMSVEELYAAPKR